MAAWSKVQPLEDCSQAKFHCWGVCLPETYSGYTGSLILICIWYFISLKTKQQKNQDAVFAA